MLRGALTAASVLVLMFCGGPGAHVGPEAVPVDRGTKGSPWQRVVAPDVPLDYCFWDGGRLFNWAPKTIVWFKSRSRERLFKILDLLAESVERVVTRRGSEGSRREDKAKGSRLSALGSRLSAFGDLATGQRALLSSWPHNGEK